MGGPMWWGRLMGRNSLAQLGPEPYSDGYIEGVRPRNPYADTTMTRGYIAGELWRMRHDYFERADALASVCEITREQADRALRAFFTEPEPDCAKCQERVAAYERGVHIGGASWLAGRCDRHEFIWLRVPEEVAA